MYCVYLVIDNFSRKILSYSVQDKVSGLVTTETIKEAYSKALKLAKNKNQELNVKLIVDGGPENNNIHIDNFISQNQINIEKLIALKDIDYSNSMIERANRTLKYNYIFVKEPRDLKHLKRILRYFIKDYNTQRPHGQLKGLTPQEAWLGFKPDEKFRIKTIKKAKAERLNYSKQNRCGKCLNIRK